MATSSSPYASFLDPTRAGAFQIAGAPAGPGSPTQPASFGGPVPAGQTPPPSVNPQVVYTDSSGKGYDPAALNAAWTSNSTFRNDPLNARVGDIVGQYSTSGAGMAPTIGGAAPTGTSTASTGATVGSAFGAPAGLNDPRSSAFFDQLMSRIDQNPSVGAEDPVIKAGTDAYRAEQTRGSRDYLAGVAEKAGPYGNVGAETRLASERAGQNTGAFQAGLMQQERTARRSQIQNLLSLGGTFLTAQQQQALTQEMHNMDLSEQARTTDLNDAYRYSPFAAGVAA